MINLEVFVILAQTLGSTTPQCSSKDRNWSQNRNSRILYARFDGSLKQKRRSLKRKFIIQLARFWIQIELLRVNREHKRQEKTNWKRYAKNSARPRPLLRKLSRKNKRHNDYMNAPKRRETASRTSTRNCSRSMVRKFLKTTVSNILTLIVPKKGQSYTCKSTRSLMKSSRKKKRSSGRSSNKLTKSLLEPQVTKMLKWNEQTQLQTWNFGSSLIIFRILILGMLSKLPWVMHLSLKEYFMRGSRK